MDGKRKSKGAASPEPAQGRRVDFLTARQLAEFLQVSESTVHRLRRAGKIPAVAITGRIIRFNLRDVRTALRAMQREQDEALESGRADDAAGIQLNLLEIQFSDD